MMLIPCLSSFVWLQQFYEFSARLFVFKQSSENKGHSSHCIAYIEIKADPSGSDPVHKLVWDRWRVNTYKISGTVSNWIDTVRDRFCFSRVNGV